VNASMMLVALLAILGIAAECVTLLLLKAHEMTPVLSTPKQIDDSVISGESDRNSCLVGSWKQDGPVEPYTRFLEDMDSRKWHFFPEGFLFVPARWEAM